MLSIGKVFYLNAPTETLFLRLKEGTKRPLFTGLSEDEVKNKIILAYTERRVLFASALYCKHSA